MALPLLVCGSEIPSHAKPTSRIFWDSQLTHILLIILYWAVHFNKVQWAFLSAGRRGSGIISTLTPSNLVLEGVHKFSTQHLAAQVLVKMCLLKCKDRSHFTNLFILVDNLNTVNAI